MSEHTIVNMDKNNGHIVDDVSQWNSDQVKSWFRQNGYKDIETILIKTHYSLNGQTLLTLSRDSLQQFPFNMTDLHEIDHLNSCIEALRKEQLTNYMKKIELNGKRNGLHSSASQHLLGNGRLPNERTYSSIIVENGDCSHYSEDNTALLADDDGSSGNSPPLICSDQYPSEKLKALIAVLYMMFGFVVSVFMLQLVHERVPSMTEDPPLPDIFFDIIPARVEGAFSVCESVGIILFLFTVVIFVFHKHRFILLRRIAFIMGTLYLYRSCTMYVTTLPVPGLHFKCAPKAHGKISVMLHRAAGLLYGGGLSVTGSHNLCGDYLFSGHTIILVMTYLVITEYTPKRWWWLHWLSWLLAAVGIVCILLAHDHYTVDVVVAYLLTTRLFWSYHTMCSVGALKDASRSNLLSRAWWFPLFRYFEGNVSANGRLPRQYEWPLPWPHQLRAAVSFNRRSPIKGV